MFGSVGVTIDKPRILLKVSSASELVIDESNTAEPGPKTKIEALVRRFLQHYGLREAVRVCLKERIPEHVGLGSGTQLALSIAVGLTRFFQRDIPVEELSKVMMRGHRSGIGIAAFTKGGFLIDGGHKIEDQGSKIEGRSAKIEDCDLRSSIPQSLLELPPILFRHPFPDNWIFLVVIPEIKKGLSGETEQNAFKQLPPPSSQRVGEICRILVMKLLPALIEKDLKSFGEALTQIQRLVGSYFAPVQGGLFADKICEELITYMLACGAAGAGQSSWGPAVYGLVEGKENASELERKVRAFIEGKVKAMLFHAHGQNKGAEIVVNDEQ
jgi:beta-RFAP synthase